MVYKLQFRILNKKPKTKDLFFLNLKTNCRLSIKKYVFENKKICYNNFQMLTSLFLRL